MVAGLLNISHRVWVFRCFEVLDVRNLVFLCTGLSLCYFFESKCLHYLEGSNPPKQSALDSRVVASNVLTR